MIEQKIEQILAEVESWRASERVNYRRSYTKVSRFDWSGVKSYREADMYLNAIGYLYSQLKESSIVTVTSTSPEGVNFYNQRNAQPEGLRIYIRIRPKLIFTGDSGEWSRQCSICRYLEADYFWCRNLLAESFNKALRLKDRLQQKFGDMRIGQLWVSGVYYDPYHICDESGKLIQSPEEYDIVIAIRDTDFIEPPEREFGGKDGGREIIKNDEDINGVASKLERLYSGKPIISEEYVRKNYPAPGIAP